MIIISNKRYMTNEDKEKTIELFKSHYSANETAFLLGLGYATIREIYRKCELNGIEKYDRALLITDKVVKEIVYGVASNQR